MSEPLARPVPPPFAWAERWCSVGVTGTNGKSSTTAMVAAALAAAGEPVVEATTLGYRVGGREVATPRSWDAFMAILARADAAGCRRAAIEVTSQALARGHARRWRFDHAVFTNLSEDHLAMHGSWEHYLASKAQLFIHLGPGRSAILNAGDPASLLLDQVIPGDVRRVWYGVPGRGESLATPDLAAQSIEVSVDGTAVVLAPSPLAAALGGRLEVAMVGEVFAENALAAAAAALACGIPGERVRAGIGGALPLRGRFEVVHRRPTVAIDYAHTPDALARTMTTARALAGMGRVIAVFGAGGGADPGKREPMGAAVADRVDLAIVTTDNPRDEAPAAIAAAVLAGARGRRAEVRCELDRERAIAEALAAAGADDVVVIAGKGHERGQIARGEVLPFSDHEAVAALLRGG